MTGSPSAAASRRDLFSDAPRTHSRFHQRILAEEILLSRGGADLGRVTPTLSAASIDLNPHQLEAAIFALESLPFGGCILGDEVGLGKTVEAGLVIAQLVSEGRGRILILVPAPLRAQWRDELWDKFGLVAECVDGPAARASGRLNPFDLPVPVICSVPFAANRADALRQVPWDLVVIDEAHRLRNAYRPTHKTGRALRQALAGVPKLLLTATPLQNSLMELYGLVSLIDETILGTEESFRALYGPLLQPPPPEDHPEAAQRLAERAQLMEDLKERLSPVIHRTLRRQVREYVKYTNRRSIVEDFRPSPEEQELYDRVSEYLCRERVAAIPPERRTLLTLCYRKILGSSTFAIAATLEKLADGLEARIRRAKEVARAQAEHLAMLLEMDDDQDGIEEEVRRIYEEEAEELLDDRQIGDRKPMSMEECEAELAELREMAALARSIRRNAKGDALVRALRRAFDVAAQQGWPQKAVIFTESRRTQAYLKELLEEAGYTGKISILCGDGAGPEERKRLVEEFRNETQILVSTEAGAEGLNLQFCNLLINYDLPWNPQRIEQRIGRCHRYGQTRDVLVINMVNRSNAAEARLYELLEQKLSLFDGVFGASDEVLGALDSGVDFERRVLEIYQSCRSEKEVDEAFARLRAEMEAKIHSRMEEARSALLDRFDEQVRARLRMRIDEAREALRKGDEKASALALSVLGEDADRRGDVIDVRRIPPALLEAAGGELATGLYSLRSAREAREAGLAKLGPGSPLVKAAARVVRNTFVEGPVFLALDASRAPADLAPLFGKEGWWFAYKLVAGDVEPEERIAHIVLVREGSTYRSLDPDTAALFVEVPAEETDLRPAGGTSVSVSTAQENALARVMARMKEEVEARRQAAADRARDRWDRFTEEVLQRSRSRVEEARLAWEAARKALIACPDPAEAQRLRRERDSREREYRRRLDQLRLEEQRRYADKDRALLEVQKKATVSEIRKTLLATSYWFLR